MDNNLLSRLGTFFILVGFGFLILFVGSVFARELSILYLLLTAATLFLGFVFQRAAPHPDPTRFSGIRKASQRSRQRREEKQIKKTQIK
jgi:cytochrome c biogenesis protein CcdA